MKKHFGVLFDCDGTLADSLNLGLGSYNYALAKLGENSREAEEIKSLFGAGADKIFFKLLGDHESALRAFELYLEHEALQVRKVMLHEGIRALLDNLKDAAIPMGVVTGRHNRDLNLIFEQHQLHRYFDVIICDNHVERSKPSPDGIKLAASRMGLAPEKIYYIGDSVMDLKAATAAGSKGIAALWDGGARADEMKTEEPALLANHPDHIWEYLVIKEKRGHLV